MKMYLISDNIDTYTGMRLAGVEGVVVHERDEAPGKPWSALLQTRKSGSFSLRKNLDGNSRRSLMKSGFTTKLP